MGGLIPLLLPSGGGSRIVPSDGYESRRRASVQESSNPLPPAHRRQQSLPIVTTRNPRRPSISTTVQQITVLPYTADEWKKTLSEVKQKYLNRKYRTCSAKCCEILDHLKDTSNIEPLHLVYLHFYAASSFEMCARPLSQSSTYRTKLLRDAREHYEDAALLIEKAEEATTQKSRSGSVSSIASQSPSLPSCLNASALSPRSSLSSGDEKPAKRPKKKKKVSFSGLPDLVEVSKPTMQPEPYMRPDSPTLGWEETYFVFGAPEPAQQQQQPAAAASGPLASVAETDSEPESPAPSPRDELTFPERSSTPAPPADDDGHTFNLELFLQTRSMNRLISQLSALRSQISYHRDAIEGLLVSADEAAEVPSVPEVPPVPSIPGLTRNVSPFSASSSSAEDSDGPPTPTSTTVAMFEQNADYSPKTQASPGFFDLEAHMRRMEEQQQQQQQQQLKQRQHPTYFTMPDWSKGSSSPTAATHGRSQSSAGPYYIPSRPTMTMEPMGRPRSSDSNSSEATMTPSINARQQMGYQIQRPASAAAIARPASTTPSFSSSSDEALRDRIERLRAGGWQRKRFDNRRYEALREQVLGELGA